MMGLIWEINKTIEATTRTQTKRQQKKKNKRKDITNRTRKQTQLGGVKHKQKD